MSNYFKILIGFLLLSFALMSCENDIDHHDHSHDFQKQNIKVVKFNNIKDNGVKERLQNTKLNKNVNGRTVFDSINNFTVDLDKGVLIEKEGYDSYTFNIIREDSTSNYLENLVIGVYPNNEYKTFLYRYEVTPAEREMIKNFQFVDVTQKLNIYVIENTSIISEMSNKELYEPCYETVITQVPSYYVCPEGNHDITNYSACPYYQDGSATIREGYFTISTSIISCDDTGGSDTGNNDSTASGDTGTNSTSEGSSNTSSGSNTNNEITTLPYEPCTDCLELTPELSEFISDLTELNLFNYWDSLSIREKENIVNFLIQNNYSPEAIDFAIELIDASIDTGLTFDIEKSLNSPAFIDINSIDITTQEGRTFDCVFNKLMNSNNFKNLYNEIFNDNNKINLEFEIVDLNSTTKGGDTQAFYTFDSNNQITGIKNKIRINTYVLNNYSTLYVANVIVHEMLHAYLNVQQIDFGTDIYNLNNYDSLGDILVQNANGVISIITNGATTDSHAFMFNYMIPAFTDIYNEILSELVNQNQLDYQVGSDISNPNTGEFYESWNTQNMLYYLSTTGLDKDKNDLSNSNYMTEIGSQINKKITRDRYITDAKSSFTKLCN